MSQNDEWTVDPLIAWIDMDDGRPLRSASEAEVEASLRRLLDREESEGPDYDVERLPRAAVALRAVGRWNAPAVAVSWLRERPNRQRLWMVLGVLLVAWNRQPGQPPVDPAPVQELLSVYEGLPFDILSDNGLVGVLTLLSKGGLPAPAFARVRAALQRSREVPDRDPFIRQRLDAFFREYPE